jgi:hypothetical protein
MQEESKATSVKEALAEQARNTLEQYPKEKAILATEDGMFFLEKDKSLAHDHNRKVVKAEVHRFEREATEEPEVDQEEDSDLDEIKTHKKGAAGKK